MDELRTRYEGGINLKASLNRDEALTGLRYRKFRTLSMMDFYPVSGFHLSYGFRSWKGKVATLAPANNVGRLNMQSVSPLLPVRSTHANLSPMATMGYESKIARFTQIGFEAGMISEHGSNSISSMPGTGGRQRWSNTGAIAQASMKMRFF